MFHIVVILMFMTLLGSAVAVKCIFSSGRDTIPIFHASLQPETICTLMVLKHLEIARGNPQVKNLYPYPHPPIPSTLHKVKGVGGWG